MSDCSTVDKFGVNERECVFESKGDTPSSDVFVGALIGSEKNNFDREQAAGHGHGGEERFPERGESEGKSDQFVDIEIKNVEQTGEEVKTLNVNKSQLRVSDLVWGKSKSHPWWPGQIIDHSSSSETALKRRKKDGLLVAYFGDNTFAWNDVSQMKPFQTHFAQIVKQSNSGPVIHAIDCALNEICRRIEFGLACSCLSKDVYDKIKTQTIRNAGIRQESIIREGVDDFSGGNSFIPVNLVKYLKAVAQRPQGGIDKLELTIARAQLLAFNRWKGFNELPKFIILAGLKDDGVGAHVSKVKQKSKGATEDASWVPKESQLISLRKQKLNSKYSKVDGRNELSEFKLLSGRTEDDDVDVHLLNEIKNAEGAGEDAGQVSKGKRRVSSRKPKPNTKYSEDEIYYGLFDSKMLDGMTEDDVVDACVSGEMRHSGGVTQGTTRVPKVNKRVSSRKRKPNTKYKEDEGYYELSKSKKPDGLKEDDVDVYALKEIKESAVVAMDASMDPKGNKRVPLQKQTPIAKCSEDEGYDAHESKEKKNLTGITKNRSLVSDRNKRVLSRKQKPNSKCFEYEGHHELPKFKTLNELKEDVANAHVLEEMKDSEGITEDAGKVSARNRRVSSRKRKPVATYNEDDNYELLEFKIHDGLENTVGVNVSTEIKDSGGLTEDASWVPEGHKRHPSRKRKPNTKYSEDTVQASRESTSAAKKHKNGDSRRKREENSGSFGSSGRKITLKEYPPTDSMLSQLHTAAREPRKGYAFLAFLITFFSDCRNFSCQGPKRRSGSKASEVEGGEYSYWTNMIIGSNYEEEVELEPETIRKVTNSVGYADGKPEEEYTPTAVILFFQDVDSVPSKSDMHHIFGCYGPLHKSNTEVVKRLRRARVVFKRRRDAENAFKSTGRFSIFGPSLVSYRISYFYPE